MFRASRENKGHLHKLRRLDGDEAQIDPVAGAIPALPKEQIGGQQQNGAKSRRIPQLHGQVDIPQHQPQYPEQDHPQNKGGELLEQGGGRRAGRYAQPQGGEKKSGQQYAQPLKPAQPEADPFHRHQSQKAGRQRPGQFVHVVQHQRQAGQKLK